MFDDIFIMDSMEYTLLTCNVVWVYGKIKIRMKKVDKLKCSIAKYQNVKQLTKRPDYFPFK